MVVRGAASASQDGRFGKKDKHEMSKIKVAEYKLKVDWKKIVWPPIHAWVTRRVTELLKGVEDEILVGQIVEFLNQETPAKDMHYNLLPFLLSNTALFMKELWTLLHSASESATGIPREFEEEERRRIEQAQAQQAQMHDKLRAARERQSMPAAMDRARGSGASSSRPHDDLRNALASPASRPRERADPRDGERDRVREREARDRHVNRHDRERQGERRGRDDDERRERERERERERRHRAHRHGHHSERVRGGDDDTRRSRHRGGDRDRGAPADGGSHRSQRGERPSDAADRDSHGQRGRARDRRAADAEEGRHALGAEGRTQHTDNTQRKGREADRYDGDASDEHRGRNGHRGDAGARLGEGRRREDCGRGRMHDAQGVSQERRRRSRTPDADSPGGGAQGRNASRAAELSAGTAVGEEQPSAAVGRNMGGSDDGSERVVATPELDDLREQARVSRGARELQRADSESDPSG